ALLDWQTFLKVFLSQSRLFYGAGAEVFFTTVVQSKITATKFFTDGWVTLGWISAFIISLHEWRRDKGGTVLTLALISYLFVFLIFGSEGYGWYRFPFYPFLAILISRLFQLLFNKPNLLVYLGLFLLPFGTTLHRLVGLEGFQNYISLFRISTLGIFGIFGLSLLNKETSDPLQKLVLAGLSLLLVALSVVEILSLNYGNWFFVT
ncbi:hypothetical protein HY045_01280, partial [Candidatus Woesebacteria bacterium]|nr:hypothetical protein [Candidatus Woesebacteria bacterium]